jgi:D-alanyl-D-alanine carboxypeptidase (penicillin-binding protein 5/6)
LLSPAKDLNSLIPSDIDPSSIQRIVDIPKQINAPVKKGDVIGTLKLKLADKQFETVNLVATENAGRSTILYAWELVKNALSSIWFKIIVGVLLLIGIVYIFVVITYNKKRKKYKAIKRKRKF